MLVPLALSEAYKSIKRRQIMSADYFLTTKAPARPDWRSCFQFMRDVRLRGQTE